MQKPLIALDVECLPNYFLIGFKNIEGTFCKQFEIFGDDVSFSIADINSISNIIYSTTTFGFNSNKYDIPMIFYALSGAPTGSLFGLSMQLLSDRSVWEVLKSWNISIPIILDHFDLIEPSPAVMCSLKTYGSRLCSKKLWDFFVDPTSSITYDDAMKLAEYNINDLDVTIDLYNAISDRIQLRIEMGVEYGLDLRSKSDAQIAEAIIISEVFKLTGVSVNKPFVSSESLFKYKAPSYISFASRELNELVEEIELIDFELATNGALKMPPILAKKKIKIGNTIYKLGIGGLHSQEKVLRVENTHSHVMRNADFASYYPFIILNNNLAPSNIGSAFLTTYRSIVERRIQAKKEGNKLVDKSLKIVINGSFGKFGSKYSKLYSPELLLATTLTGQLTLLMLIEMFENSGIAVMSANTDGLEYFCPKDKIQIAINLCNYLEYMTGYTIEHGEYEALYARDVNNYVAKYPNKVKAKGVYADPFNDSEHFLKKGLENRIVTKAVRDYIAHNKPVHETILNCTNINDFLSARVVKGGAVWGNMYLGKTVRWYHSIDGKSINYRSNGNLVPKTATGVTPMMTLENEIPSNLNYQWYINDAISMLDAIGIKIAIDI